MVPWDSVDLIVILLRWTYLNRRRSKSFCWYRSNPNPNPGIDARAVSFVKRWSGVDYSLYHFELHGHDTLVQSIVLLYTYFWGLLRESMYIIWDAKPGDASHSPFYSRSKHHSDLATSWYRRTRHYFLSNRIVQVYLVPLWNGNVWSLLWLFRIDSYLVHPFNLAGAVGCLLICNCIILGM